VDYTEKAIENTESALTRLYTTLERVSEKSGSSNTQPKGNDEIDDMEARFYAAMDDDFNTALALSAVFDLATLMNRLMDEGGDSALPFVVRGRDLLLSLANLLGLLTDDVAAFMRYESHRHLARVGLDEGEVEGAIEDRAEARRTKDFKKADEIRSRLLEKGITLLDSPQGTKWRIKK